MISYFAEQNKLIDADKHKMSTAKKLNLATLGLLEAGIDGKYMSKSYPEFAMNNTYGIEVYSKEVYKETMELLNDPKEGCLALIDACRAAAAEGDPQSFGTNETVNNVCVVATDTCYGKVQNALVDNSYVRLSRVCPRHKANDATAKCIRHHPIQPHRLAAVLQDRFLQPALGAGGSRCTTELHLLVQRHYWGIFHKDWRSHDTHLG